MTLNNCTNLNEVQYMVGGIDGTTVAVTPLFTSLATAGDFYVTNIIFILENVGGVATGDIAFSLGYNAPTYTNVNITDNPGATFTATGQYFFGSQQGTATPFSLPPATTVSMNVSTAESTATTYDLKVLVIGNYI